VLSWKRPHNLPAIVADVGRHPFIDEILIWNNDPSVRLEFGDPRVRVLESPENLVCHGRFLCALEARNSVVYVQDDDSLLRNLDELASVFAADPTRIAHALRPSHFAERGLNVHGPCEVALVGWGAFLMRDWVHVLDAVPAPLRTGDLFRREADKFFSVLLECRHTAIKGDIRLLEGHSEPGLALWLEPEHRRMAARAVREALRLVRERRSPGSPAPWHVVVVGGDDGRFLAEAVESVTANAADYELTVVDAGTTDAVTQLVERLAAADRLTMLRSPQRDGHAAARDLAIRNVDSAVVACLYAGDQFGPRYLSEAGAVLAGNADLANPDAILVGPVAGRWAAPATITLEGLRAHNAIHYAAGFRRCQWAVVGGFGETTGTAVNHDFWLRIISAGARAARVPGDHFYHRPPADGAVG
jgi:hypothetical protein